MTTQYKVQFWVAEWRLRNAWAANFYLQNAATAPAYDVARRTADLVSESRMPADSAFWFAQADKEQRKRRYLLLLDIALVIGLSCATAAQFTRRRTQLLCAAWRHGLHPRHHRHRDSGGVTVEDLRDTVEDLRETEEIQERTTKVSLSSS